MSSARVGLVTCAVLPEPDPDQAPLLAALRAEGVEPEMVAWDDPGAEPGAFDLCLLRSPWNFYLDPGAFQAWIDRAARETRLVNSSDVVRWNLHKGYLRELERGGVPVVPTAWVARGERADLARVIDERGWREVVVKPAISAASYRTRRFARADVDQGQEFLDDLARDGDAMVQVYLPSVESGGEQALVWIDGEFTHAVAKSPRFVDEDEAISGERELDAAERAFGRRVLELAPGDLLYARVDAMAGDDGEPLLSELELVEPSLFLVQWPAALQRFVRGVLERLG